MNNFKRSFLFFIAILVSFATHAQVAETLYSEAYGEKTYPAIIYLHGGPGYNAFSFEGSTAQRLADEGYYVIVYDQRGSGRSANPADSKYDFAEAIADLNSIYTKYGIDKATLLGHSWGGAVGVVFAEQHPDKVKNLVLIGAPMDYQQTFKAIIANSRTAYKAQGKDEQLKYLLMLEQMDSKSLPYANYCFLHAMSSGQYTAKAPAANVQKIYNTLMASPHAQQLQNMTEVPVAGFYKTEQYTTLILYDRLLELKKKVPIYGMFGSDDGLFDETQLDAISNAIGKDHFTIVQNASHSIFIDQQEEFIKTLLGYIK